MDPSKHSFVIPALLLSTAVLVMADCLISWLCARGASKSLCQPVFRAGLRAGQAAGLFGLFAAAGLGPYLSVILPVIAYIGTTLLLSDTIAGRAVSGRPHVSSGPDAPGGKPPAGLSVVASRAERLRDISVSRLMIPRKSIVACNSSAKVEEVASIMRETGLSRVIVFSKVLDKPLGLAHIKDVLPLVYEGKGAGEIKALLRPLVLIPSSARALDLLRDFQRLKRRVAIVRDLQGDRTLGIVSTEDILEEMVGEIQDEDDELSAALESGVALVRGDLTVVDLTEGLGMPPYRDKGDITVGELVKSLLGAEPKKGDTVGFRGLRMTVEEMLEGDIWMVRLDRSGE